MNFDPNSTNSHHRTGQQIKLAQQQVELTQRFMAFDPDRASGWVLGQRGNVPLCMPLEGHLMTFGASGSGKGTAVAIPNLLMHRGSVVSFETDKATFDATWFYRKNVLGQRILVIDPYGITGFESDRVNLLAEVRRHGDRDLYDHALGAVHALFGEVAERSASSKGDNQIFSQSAADIVIAHVLYMCSEKDRFPGKTLTFDNLRQHLAGFGMGEGHDLAPQMQEAIDGRHPFVGAYRSAINHLINLRRDNRNITQYGVFFSVESPLAVVNNPKIEAVSQDATFSFEELEREPTTLYVIMPNASDYKKASPWFRLLFDRLQVSFKPDGRGGSSFTQDTRTLFLIDEFQNLGRVPDIAGAFDTVRKHGITLWTLTQSIDALEDVYGEKAVGNMLSNAAAVQILGMGYGKTLQYASERFGRDFLFVPQVQYGESKTDGDTTTVGISEAVNLGESITRGTAATISSSDTVTYGTQYQAAYGTQYQERQGWFSLEDDQDHNDSRGKTDERKRRERFKASNSLDQTVGRSLNETAGENESRAYQSGRSDGVNEAATRNKGTTEGASRSSTRSSSETITGSVTFSPQLVSQLDPRQLEHLLTACNMQLVFARELGFSMPLIERKAEFFRVPYFAARAGAFAHVPSPLPELVKGFPKSPSMVENLPPVSVSTTLNEVLIRRLRPANLDAIQIDLLKEPISDGATLERIWNDIELESRELKLDSNEKRARIGRERASRHSFLIAHLGKIKPAQDNTIGKIQARGRVSDGVWSKVDETRGEIDGQLPNIKDSISALNQKGGYVNHFEAVLDEYRSELLSRFNEISENPKLIREFVKGHLVPLSEMDDEVHVRVHPALLSPPQATEHSRPRSMSAEKLDKVLNIPVVITKFEYPEMPASPSRPSRESPPHVDVPDYQQKLDRRRIKTRDGRSLSLREIDEEIRAKGGVVGLARGASALWKSKGNEEVTQSDLKYYRHRFVASCYRDVADGLRGVREWRDNYGQWLEHDRVKVIGYSASLDQYKDDLVRVTAKISQVSQRIDQRWEQLASRLNQLNEARETLHTMQLNHQNTLAENPRWGRLKLLSQIKPKLR